MQLRPLAALLASPTMGCGHKIVLGDDMYYRNICLKGDHAL